MVVDLDLGLGPAARDHNGDRIAGELIVIAVLADIDGGPSLAGYIQRLGGLSPVFAVRGNVHAGSGIDGLIVHVELDIRPLGITENLDARRVAGEGDPRMGGADDDRLSGHAGDIQGAALDLGPALAVVGGILGVGQPGDLDFLFVDSPAGSRLAERNCNRLGQAGKMPGVVLGPDCQALAALIGNIIAIAYICPGFAFHDLA